jgi:hypothetical protein
MILLVTMNQKSDEIDLNKNETTLIEFCYKLYKSKFIIILSIFFFTSLALLYSLQIKPTYSSSMIIEIGHEKYSDIYNFKKISFESKSFLIKRLIDELEKQQYRKNLIKESKISGVGDRLIEIHLHSGSSEANISLLNNLLDFMEERHTNHLDFIRLTINADIDFFKTADGLDYLKYMKYDPIYPENIRMSERILSMLNTQNIVGPKLIGEIITKNNPPRYQFIISSGFVIGLAIGILLFQFISALRSYKEN